MDLKFGTLNVRGLKNSESNLADDIKKYDLDILAIQETHDPEVEDLREIMGCRDHTLYLANENKSKHHGVGIIAKKHLNATFQRMSSRVCTAQFDIKNRSVHFISAYTPHKQLANSEPEKRTQFYEDLNIAVKKGNSSSIIVVAGDFNAKTGGGFDQHSNCMGKYGKSTVVNENGHSLINFAEEHDLFLTNTKFRHKMAHRTTWTAPFRNFVTKNGEQRRNPIRNQIDYILINNQYLRFVTDSRSHGGIDTETDHKLVRMSVRLDMYKLNNKNMKAPPKIKTENFGYRDLRSNYAKKTEELLQKSEKEVKK